MTNIGVRILAPVFQFINPRPEKHVSVIAEKVVEYRHKLDNAIREIEQFDEPGLCVDYRIENAALLVTGVAGFILSPKKNQLLLGIATSLNEVAGFYGEPELETTQTQRNLVNMAIGLCEQAHTVLSL